MPNFEIDNRVQNQSRETSSDSTSHRLLEGAMILGRGAAGADNEVQHGGHGGGGGRGPNHLERQSPKELDFCAAPLQGFDDKLNNQLSDKMDDKLGGKAAEKTRSLDPGEDLRKEDHSKDINRNDGINDKNNSDRSVDRVPGNPSPWERREDGRGLQPRQHEHRVHQVPPSPKFWS